MRLKYPNIAIGAFASSAPILQFEDVVPPETFYDIVSNDFRVCLNFINLKKKKRIITWTFSVSLSVFLCFVGSVRALAASML